MAIMQLSHVSFEYPGVRALDDVSLTIRQGSISALVGPNGAGKSTLLRIMAVLQQPLTGTVLLNGEDVLAQPRQAHRNIGFLPDFFGLYDQLTVAQCLRYAAMAHKVDASRIEQTITETAALLQLQDRLHQRASTLSRGLRQRLAIAQAIVHRPPLLLLDEPASGLDPEARHHLAELFLALRDEGMTLLVSSHILSELDAYCDDMIILRQGQIIDQQRVRQATTMTRLEARTLPQGTRQAMDFLCQYDGVDELQQHGDVLAFLFTDDAQAQHKLLAAMLAADIPLVAFAARQRNMQEAYLSASKDVA